MHFLTDVTYIPKNTVLIIKTTQSSRYRSHLLGYGVPVEMALTLIHALLVQELALVRNEQGITHKLSHCSKKQYQFLHNEQLHLSILTPIM